MTENSKGRIEGNLPNSERILLMLMPFWAPLTPPLGISCLKSYLVQHGYNVKTIDANLEIELWEVQHEYFTALKDCIPDYKKGNFYLVGYEVFMNHLMAYINRTSEAEYLQLVKVLVEQNFYVEIDAKAVQNLERVIELFYSRFEKYMVDVLEREKPTIFGVSVYSSTLAASLFAFRLCKAKLPETMTIMGGGAFADQLSVGSPNFEFFVEKTKPYIDQIVIGEGEKQFVKLLQGELPLEKRVHHLQDLGGDLMELGSAGLPDFTDFDVEKYAQLAGYSSRSCPFQCSFCSETVQWGKYRKKAAKQVADELVKLNEQFGHQLFVLGDSLINPIVDDLAKERIERGLNIYYDGYLRADKPVCNPENTLRWRQGGFYRARLGVESGSQHVLDMMDKRITPAQIKEAVSSLAYAGIKTTTYWVIGHPGETEEDFQQTLDLIEELKDDIYEADWNPFYYYPSGQVASERWSSSGTSLVYPENATDMLITQTWRLHTYPSREEIYERMCRVADHVKRLGIPNPYSLQDIYAADERWKRLHVNAVPLLVELHNGKGGFKENTGISRILIAQNVEEEGDFDF